MSQKQPNKPKLSTPAGTRPVTPVSSFTNLASLWSHRPETVATPASGMSEQNTRSPSPSGVETKRLSLGSRIGPGHESDSQGRGRKRLSKQRPASRDSSLPAQAMRRSFFLRSGRSSRASSVERDALPLPPIPPAVASAANAGSRVSRISENFAEDHTDPQIAMQGNVNDVDHQVITFEENATDRSVHDDSDSINTCGDSPTDEYIISSEQVANEREKFRVAALRRRLEENAGEGSSSSPGASTPTPPGTPPGENGPMLPLSNELQADADTLARGPYLSLSSVLQGKKDFKLQNIQPMFDDPTGLYYEVFELKLRKLNGKNSENALCIEEYLMQSERDWFNRYRSIKLGRSPASSRASSIFRVELEKSDERNISSGHPNDPRADDNSEQFFLQEDYAPPKGIQKIVLRRIGTWPLYTFLLAFVRIICSLTEC